MPSNSYLCFSFQTVKFRHFGMPLRRKTSKPATRSEDIIFGLGGNASEADSKITGSRLPTKLQVIRCFKYHQQLAENHDMTRHSIAKIVLAKIVSFYEKGNIPLIKSKSALDKIVRLVDKNNAVRKTAKQRRSADTEQMDILGETLQLWPADAQKLIKNEEDRAFLRSMMTREREASFGIKDASLAAQMNRTEKRNREAESRAERSKLDVEEMFETAEMQISTESTDEEMTGDEIEGHGPECDTRKDDKKGKARPGTLVFVPFDIIKSPKIVQLATRIEIGRASCRERVSSPV